MKPVVLLVDDETHVTEGLRLALRKQPFDVLTANSAADGLSLLRSKAVNVVVSDERMPEMSGAAFLTRVRSEFPTVERIILTGQASMEATLTAINDAHVFRYLTKPCAPEVLAGIIGEAIEAQQSLAVHGERRRSTDDVRAKRDALDADLTEALTSARMVYQPIVIARDHTLYGYEALVRVDHPTLSSPAELVEAATLLERRFDLDRAVRTLVAGDLALAPEPAKVFINLLPESVDDERLLDASDPLHRFAHRVVLEITERVPLDVIDEVDAKLDRLRQHGYALALDDLGAGYAGLNSLATMQPNIVKFDRELISGIDRSPTKSKLVSAMIVVCQELDSLTLAEGVETAAEVAHLQAMQCDLLQGFAIGRPADPFPSM